MKSNLSLHNFKDVRDNFLRTELTREDTPDGRFYTLPSGKKVLSVTSIIGQNTDSTWIDEWKARVGEVEAEAIKVQAGLSGTVIHKMVEDYVTGVSVAQIYKDAMPINWVTFKKLRPQLDANVTAIMGVEHPLHSESLNTAGTTDLAAMWKCKKAIVDIKTSRKSKTKEDVPHYLIQTCAYAMMWNEMYRDNVRDLVVLIAVDHETNPVVIEDTIDNWYQKVNSMFKRETS